MIIRDQVLASTSLDAHGECFTKAELEEFARELPQQVPLNAMHDFSQPISGTATNLRLLQNKNGADWNLVGDIETNDPRFGELFKGMSISTTSPLFDLPNSVFTLALPFPAYNDQDLVCSLIKTNTISIAKWRRKGLSTEQSTILIASITIFIKPIWEDVYQHVFKPALKGVLASTYACLSQHNIALDFVQNIGFSGRLVEIRILQVQNVGTNLPDDTMLLRILRISDALLLEQPPESSPITQIVFQFDRIGRTFVASRITREDASSTSF
jgi:hypothetical protein